MVLAHAHAHRWAVALAIFVSVAGIGARTAGAQDSTAAAAHPIPLPPVDISGFVQVHYRSGDPLNKDGYRVRKADIKFTGSLSEHVKWRFSADAAKALSLQSTTEKISDTTTLSGVAVDQKSRMLQEAAVTYYANKSFQVDIGQQLVPLSFEGWIPLSHLETIERANFIADKSRAVALGYIFDLGTTVNGVTPVGLEYHAGVFNEMGDDQGSTDQNDQKAVVGRLDYHIPLVPGLTVGGGGGWEPGTFLQKKQRLGTEAQYKFGRYTLRGETMAARDGSLRRFGWYGLGAVQATSRLLFSARYDTWDKDVTAENTFNNALERSILVGANYAVDGTPGKIAVNLIHQSFPNISTVRTATFILFAFQAAW